MTWKENDTLSVAGLARRWCVCMVIPQERIGTEKLFGSLLNLSLSLSFCHCVHLLKLSQ